MTVALETIWTALRLQKIFYVTSPVTSMQGAILLTVVIF